MGVTSGPSDNTTLSAVLADYAEAGTRGSSAWTTTACTAASAAPWHRPSRSRSGPCGDWRGVGPGRHGRCHRHRLPGCNTMGTIVVMYGPEASEAEVRLLRRAQDHRFDDDKSPE